MSIPDAHIEIPARVRDLAGRAAVTPVWRNGIGGLTFRTDDGRYIKWGPLDDEANMHDEAERMRWARRWITVPKVLAQGEDDAHEWLVTRALDGFSAVERGVLVPPELHEAPPIDRLVVCHGDACMPNTLLDAAGDPAAHVDLAALGLADRWADIAAAAMSTGWNFGPGWERPLLEAYGIERDDERLEFYMRLWNET